VAVAEPKTDFPATTEHSADRGQRGYVWRLFAAAGVVVLLLAAWALLDLMLLVFAAVLVAALLVSTAGLLSRLTGIPHRYALVLACLAVAAGVGGFLTLVGAQLGAQLADLWNRLPELIAPIEGQFGVDIKAWLDERAATALTEMSVITSVAGLSSSVASMLAYLLVVVIAGVYLAFDPPLYIRGVATLFPPSARPKVRGTLGAVGGGLQRWLLGQLVAMVMVGLLVYAGLQFIGIESALALAVIAAGFEFIPLVGPFVAALPAIAIALSQGPEAALWVVLLYIAVQQIEGNLVTPLIQQQSVALPPALTMFAILAAGILFGWLGVLLATPLAVALMIAVQQLWVGEVLGDGEAEESR
jgi:predicted PurR-regulated permease PerM